MEGKQQCFLSLRLVLTLVSDEPSLTSSPESVLERAILIDWCKSSSAGMQGADNICTGLRGIRSLISAPIHLFNCLNPLPFSLITGLSVAPTGHGKRTKRRQFVEVESAGTRDMGNKPTRNARELFNANLMLL